MFVTLSLCLLVRDSLYAEFLVVLVFGTRHQSLGPEIVDIDSACTPSKVGLYIYIHTPPHILGWSCHVMPIIHKYNSYNGQNKVFQYWWDDHTCITHIPCFEYTYVYIYICICLCIYVYIYMYIYVYIYVYIYIYICIYIYACMYVM